MKKCKNYILYTLIIAVMLLGFSIDVSAASGSNPPISDGMYKVVSMVNNSYVWDINGGSTANGANLQLYKDNGSNAQKFIFTRSSDGYYTITNVNSNKVIDCDNAGKANGTNIKQYESNNSDAQKWQIKSVGNGYYTLICKCNGKAADVYDGKAANGTNIHMYQTNGTAAQKFKLEKTNIADGTYKVVSGINSKYVWDIAGGSTSDEANLQLYEDNNTNAQKFKFTKNSDGHYTITNVNSGKVIDCDNAGSANGTNIKQYSSNNSSAQRWEVRSAGNGYYTLICKCNGKAADAYDGKAANGTNIHMYKTNGTNAQKFRLIATSAVASNPTTSSTVAANGQQIINRLDEMISGSYGNGIYKINTRYKGPLANEECKGFAKQVFKICFGVTPGSTKGKPNNYLLNSVNGISQIGKVTSMNSANIKNLFSKAHPGDFVQMRRSHGGSHSAIVYTVSSTGVTFYEANLDGNNGIVKRTYTWANLCDKNAAMSVYTSNSYVLK